MISFFFFFLFFFKSLRFRSLLLKECSGAVTTVVCAIFCVLCCMSVYVFQRSEIKYLDGEIFREHYEYPGHRKTNIIITNRRVMCVKKIDVIGHFNKEWECQFENFYRPPSTEGGDLKIYYREQNKLNLIRKDGQTLVKVIHMRHAGTAERLREGIDRAQSARKQYQMARQKSQRFIKSGNV